MGNPGDMAIWLGARAALRRLGVRVRYQCGFDTLSLEALRRAVPDGPVLLTGGGDFGDLYDVGTPRTREQVLAGLRGIPVIQLPIAVFFREQANAERMNRLIASHGDVTLMVRDHLSEARARAHLDTDIRLVPDLAFGLGPQQVGADPDVDVLWNCWLPPDPEYTDDGGPPEGLTSRSIEWSRRLEREPRWNWEHRLARGAHLVLARALNRHETLRDHLWRAFAATLEPVSQGCVSRGLTLQGEGRVLVTNKLHGHVFALLAGVPHVVLDNSFGKVRGVFESWTASSELAHWAEDGEAARALVTAMA
jgi:pyruvyl transferase EpsO